MKILTLLTMACIGICLERSVQQVINMTWGPWVKQSVCL